MSRTPSVDTNEKAALLALNEADPKSEAWLTAYASGLNFAKHGADAIADTLEGRSSVLRRLATRKLIDGDPDSRGIHRGYSLNDKGRLAAGIEATS